MQKAPKQFRVDGEAMKSLIFFRFLKHQFQVTRCVARKDFDEAIRILSRGLSNSEEDGLYLYLIALCHRRAGRDDMAIDSAQQALHYNPKHFESFELLSQIYLDRSDYHTAARYARLGIQNFPDPFPKVPRFYFSLMRAAGLVIPRFKRIAERGEADITDPNKSNQEWYVWAREYLAWYDKIYEGPPLS